MGAFLFTALLAMTIIGATAQTPPLMTDIPKIGLGTYLLNLSPQNTSDAIAGAMELGYRMFDTAAIYNNEKLVAPGFREGFRRTRSRRESVWITSKLWTDHHGDKCEQGLKLALNDLGLEYLDLLLMHFPIGEGHKHDHVVTWQCMQNLVRQTGPRTRYIGISNFNAKQLDELLAANSTTIRPKYHQFENHPYLPQDPFLALHKKENINVIGYTPLANTAQIYRTYGPTHRNTAIPPLLENAVIRSIAQERNCTGAQVALAWGLARGLVVIPKSAHLYRQKENLEAVNACKLRDEDVNKVSGIQNTTVGRFNNPCRYMGAPCFEDLQADPKADGLISCVMRGC